MANTRDLINKLPKDRQEKIKKEVEEELKEYQTNESIVESLNEVLDTAEDIKFPRGQFVVNKNRFSCDINPQNKLCIEKLPLGMVPCIIAVQDDEPGYFRFIKQHSVRFGEGGQFSKMEQTPLTTKYCETRKDAALEILRLENE